MPPFFTTPYEPGWTWASSIRRNCKSMRRFPRNFASDKAGANGQFVASEAHGFLGNVFGDAIHLKHDAAGGHFGWTAPHTLALKAYLLSDDLVKH